MLPQLVHHQWSRNQTFKNPLVELETDVLFANALATTAPLVPYPLASLAEPEPPAITAIFAKNSIKGRHHSYIHF